VPGIRQFEQRKLVVVVVGSQSAVVDVAAGTSASASVAAAGKASAASYVCRGASQAHVLCTCCMQPMPDRRHDHSIGASPPQSCQ